MKVSNYRFWLVLSCAGLIGVWYGFMVLAFFGAAAVVNSNLADTSPEVYDLLLNTSSILAVFLASFVSLPFAVAVFKRLKIQMPLVSAIAFFMAPTFGFNLFAFLSGAVFYDPATIPTVLTASMGIAGLLYGFVLRPLKHKLSNLTFILLTVGVALVPIILWILWRL